MRSNLLLGLGVFLLLGGLLMSEVMLCLLPGFAASYPEEIRTVVLKREEAENAYRMILYLKWNGLVCLVGFLMLFSRQLRSEMLNRSQNLNSD